MYIYQCGKVDHNSGQVYSVDLHPNGDILATAGFNQKGKGSLVLWNLSKLYNFKSRTDSGRSSHMKDVLEDRAFPTRQNCVRWCHAKSGQYLVLAGDNPVVHLFEPKLISGHYELGESIQMVGHKMEVMHAEFSRDGNLIATCSLDTTVIVWDMTKPSIPLRVLDVSAGGHTDMVRGLVWDPIERFLITQSSDQTVRVWRIASWECERVIPGFGNPSKFYSRLDWSSDGSMLIVPCCNNNGFMSCKIIKRQQWKPEMDLIGFQGPTSCVRSAPRCSSVAKNGKNRVVNIVAVGSSDRSVSVWQLPHSARPICVVKNVMPEEILDMTWHDSLLVICGINGSIRCIEFEAGEAGTFLTDSEMALQYESAFSFVPTSHRASCDANNDLMKELNDVLDELPECHSQCNSEHLNLQAHSTDHACSQCIMSATNLWKQSKVLMKNRSHNTNAVST